MTVVSKRDSSSTLSTFSRVVRSLFRRSPSPSPIDSSPQLVALPQHTAAPYTKGHRTSRRQHQAAAALSRRSQSTSKKSKRSLPEPRIGIVIPSRPKNIKRSNKLSPRQNYDAGSAQASIYAAAVAALDATSSSSPSPQITAQPVALNMEVPASLPPITLTMTLTPNSQGQYIDAAAPLPTQTLESKLRHRRSTFAERSLARKQQQQQQDTSQLKRSINPKTGSSPSSPSASQTQESAPKWTAIAHF